MAYRHVILSNTLVGYPRELDPAEMMNTPIVHAPEVIAAYGVSAEEMVCRRDEQCPMGRMGDAWDVAYAALFPASDEAEGAEFESAIGPLGAVLTFTLRARRGD